MTAPSPRTSSYVHPDEARMAAFRRVYENCLVVEDIYPGLARRFEEAGTRTFVELGGGRGPIATVLAGAGARTCVIDRDETMLAEAHRPAVRGDLCALPLRDESIDGAAAVNCLYFLTDPRVALHEARRVLHPGGLFVASAPSRYNDPELQRVDPDWGTPSSFDSEDAPALVGEIFEVVEVREWRVAAYVLPDRQAIADYLHAFNIPDWENKVLTFAPPLTITKVGAEVWARR